MKQIIIVFLFLPSVLLEAQISTLSGIVKDASSGELLLGANIYFTGAKLGIATNEYGFYSITLPAQDSIGLVCSYLGYEAQIKKIYFSKSMRLDIELQPTSSALKEVVVSSERNADNVRSSQMGVIDIPTAKIRELPAILGEVDVLKVIQLLPGIQSGNEGTTGFHVRGGNADQNLVQLDEAIIYNPNHLFGLLSAFNSRAINNVSIIKGGFPAQYGGRLSSILDISMKEGNSKRLGVEGGIGLITSQLTVEGPLKKDIASFIISGRRTYFDYLVKPFLPKAVTTNYFFYDMNAKLNWQIGTKDHLFVSYFTGLDDAFYSQDGIKYELLLGNTTGTLRWNHIFGQKLFLNTSIILNKYEQNIAALQDNAAARAVSGISDFSGKLDFQYYPGPRHRINFGLHFFDHEFRSTGDAKSHAINEQNDRLRVENVPAKYFDEVAAYFNDEITLDRWLRVNLGIRVPTFFEKDISYYRIEPRTSIRLQIDDYSSIKGSYTVMNQFLHQIPSTTAAVPSDIWIPSTRLTKPQYSEQYAIGYYQNSKDNVLETSVQLYYKNMRNQVLFREGNQLIQTLDVDPLLTYGRGWSYGAEWFLKKKLGRLTGWAAYTLAWTYQQFDDLNFGNRFPFRHDRRHDLSLVGSYVISDRWKLSATFVYSSGNTYTVPVARTHVVNGGTLFEGNYFIYEGRNNARLNPYHRLNISVSNSKKTTIFGQTYTREWVLSFYNLYSRQNPYFIYFQVDPLTQQPKAKQVALLPILPSITFNFEL